MATSDEQRTCNVVQLGDGSAEAWLREHDKQHENGRVHLGCCQSANILRVLFQQAPQVRAEGDALRDLLSQVEGFAALYPGLAEDFDTRMAHAALAANPQQEKE